MRKAEFDRFLKGIERDKSDERPIDWEKEKQDWIRFVDELYNQILKYISEFKKDKRIRDERRTIVLAEENIGQYQIDQLVLHFAGTEVVFNPLGTLLIGAKGRVDMTTPKGIVRFVLVPQEATGPRLVIRAEMSGHQIARDQTVGAAMEPIAWVWKIARREQDWLLTELTEESFFSSLMEVVNA